MSTAAELEVKAGTGFFLFPGHSMARAKVVEVIPPAEEASAIIRISLTGIDPDEVYHLKRSEAQGEEGGILFDASEGYVRDMLVKDSERPWE